MATAGCHTGGRHDSIECLEDAIDRSEFGVESLSVEVAQFIVPVIWQAAANMGFDLCDHEFVGSAHETLDYLGLAHSPTELGKSAGFNSHGDPLTVHQHSDAIEDN
jgi:hypothetical protein